MHCWLCIRSLCWFVFLIQRVSYAEGGPVSIHSVRALRVGAELGLPCKSVSAVPKVGPGLGNGLMWMPVPLRAMRLD